MDPDSTPVELRGMAPRWVVDILDALAQAGHRSRWDVVSHVLTDYVQNRKHEAIVICRLSGCNGHTQDDNGK